MTNRQRVKAILHYEPYDRMPVVSFGYWDETLDKWASEGHIDPALAAEYRAKGDNSSADRTVMDMLGFDFNWNRTVGGNSDLFPAFEEKLIEQRPDGGRVISDSYGHIVLVKPGVVSIPSEIGTLLTDRAAWEAEYLPRLRFSEDRIDRALLETLRQQDAQRDEPLAFFVGSLYGRIRDWIGVEHLAYLMADDEDLFAEIVQTHAQLCYDVAKAVLESGVQFDYAHYWEDICFNNGPLINPALFRELVGPLYAKMSALIRSHGIDITSLDCDGCIDRLVPIWLENGVNTMFPIEVGTWNASIAPWRAQYGRDLRGVGGMDKRVFAHDKAAIDREIERLKPLVELGGYIPCPDHRIAPDAKFELVQYYCDRFRAAFW